jgi:hypothetical protein|tara:strand:+ start:215 stop:595 length:381 start_codon:yes stop_codon:yes gene_type:complete
MPILKTHNLAMADFKENKNVFYVYPDNYSLIGGDSIIQELRNSDYGVPVYTSLSKSQSFIYERGMAMLDESMEKIKYLLDSKAIVFVLVNKFYDIIDYDNAEEYQRSIIDEINIVIEKGQPKGVRI